MAAAAAAVQAAETFSRAPTRHVVFAAGVIDDRNPLAALGELLSRAGAVALCTDRARCAAHFRKREEMPLMPLLPLMLAKARAAAPSYGLPSRAS